MFSIFFTLCIIAFMIDFKSLKESKKNMALYAGLLIVALAMYWAFDYTGFTIVELIS